MTYNALENVRDWKFKLSDRYIRENRVALFELEGRRWASVDHYVQAKRYPSRAAELSLDSGSQISRRELTDDVAAWLARTARPAPKFDRESQLALARRAKFTRNADLKKILALTGKALLISRDGADGPPRHDAGLMALRDELARA